ncbi:AAA family ATPase [Dendronalium sp. ChiSLP03b]|uniref:ATP-binding sensor histidine kinase n=1 Tax=Dendronalium sp. ChiSLP03b TaxID=3075381 RepID=UPI002AD2DD16|nr:AAA family ATPase [Dendronalium sp. ChiSLP03b]MDZ8204901.1 AAA family ATPase [Dendronalium sp. ChiSLP03b]
MLVLSDTIFTIPGYRITEQIYSGSKTLVYRGIREHDQKSAIVKLMRNEYPTFNEIAQFRNQYTITKNLDNPGIVKPLGLENYRNGYALVVEDFGGISLKDWGQGNKGKQGNGLALREFFHIAITIASTLEQLHRDRIIHKDIKPANILIKPNTLEVRLIDFSIATLLPREIQCLTNPNVLEGTLAYISPEQTGRMNRGIDYRSDFYSLGVTFFELLTGHLPFTPTDPMELVYCHIAKQPPTVSQINSNIPPIVSLIVHKLMAKNAEDRYQSAYGLRYDLEECRNQWQHTEKIIPFELGARDISDRFLIPEKLYGRQKEVEKLLAAFERVSKSTTEIILVAGFSGIGKTAVVNEVHKPIVRQRGYFIKGKFDQFQRDIPLSALVQAFRDLIGQILLETDAQIHNWRTKLLAALGEQSQVIVDVIPELELIIGKQPEVTELSGSAAENRFNLLLQRFIHVFTATEHPLVIFLDDLQWADTASLKLIQLLISQTKSSGLVGETEKINGTQGGFLLIGAYRDNEVTKAHPLDLTLKEIQKTGASISTITLTPLTQSDLNRLIADTLKCPEQIAIALTQMVYAKTKGNPFFSHEFLKALHKDGLIEFNFNLGYWQYDLAKIQALALTDDVVEFMTIQLLKLPKQTQQVLKLAACVGNQFDLKTLAIVHEESAVDTASDLWPALLEGLILPQTEVYKLVEQNSNDQIISLQGKEFNHGNYPTFKYKFIHDRVQQAAYSLIPKQQKQAIHLKIGQLLLNNTPVLEREDKIFELVNQFNIAVPLINIPSDREQLAQMNLTSGRKALASTAYPAALKYLTTGIKLLTGDTWETKYELTLALYETAAEAAYLAGDFEQMEQLAEVALQKAQTLLEKVKLYEVKIQAYGAQNQALEAVNTALSFLKLLGVGFPENASQSDVQLAMAEITSNLIGRSIEDLIDLPEMREAQIMAIMRILSSATSLSYQTNPNLFLLIIFKQVNLSLQHGNVLLSAFAYVSYGFVLCAMGDIESGYQFGKLAFSLLTKCNAEKVTIKTMMVFNTVIRHWKEHSREILKPLLECYSAGLEMGDLEYAAYSINNYSYSAYFIAKELTGLESEMSNYSHAIRKIKQETVFHWNEIYRQTILNLSGAVENPSRLIGEAYDEEKMLPIHLAANDVIGLLYSYVNKLHLCYLFYEFPQAVENSILAEKYLGGGTGQLVIPFFHFYDSLAQLAIYADADDSEQKRILDRVQANQEKMQDWAHHAPMNYLHKFYLVEAERYRILGQYLPAMDDYDRAITLAKENEYINEEALAHELAAKFYLEWNKQKIAQTYLTDAYYCYVRWGAKAKVDDLQQRYPQLLAHIIQQEKLKLTHRDKTTTEPSISLSSLITHETVVSSNTSISQMLDLASVMKASQALSGEIELEQLLSTLMAVVMENAGASKSALILSEGDRLGLSVTAVSSNSTLDCISTEFPSTHLDSSGDVPITLINYVKRTKEIFVIDDVKGVDFLSSDRYIIREQPKSLLCIPIINQGKLLGILYLENNLTTVAFTRDRVEVLKLLTTQAAISLENAILYNNLTQANQHLEESNHTLEEKVAQRTTELNDKNQRLEQALSELQSTQSQLIQSEKMSSLGEMVAGIAHEINNPINFIHGNITHASEYVQDLLDLIAIYQQEYPNPSALVEDKALEIDVDFLAEDLPKILDSMKVGSSRIRNIVLGLRNFSRLDESEMKPVDIHEGIDNTLMILQHRLKEKSDRPEIEVIKKYGQFPEVSCYAGQLNQVFMNILSNAIDALEESLLNSQQSIVNGLGTIDCGLLIKPQIRICTELKDSNTLRIRIADNGRGMTAKVCQKIFDPFFTTKPIGSGTGLGLSISYQVVVDKHKGQLTCDSTIGKGTEFVIEIPMQQ